MSNIELILSESSSLEFETDITGITNESVDVSFVIENDGIGMSFKGTLLNGIVSVEFPILTNVLEAKTYDAKLVFVIEGTKYFEPMKTQVDFVQPINITTNIKKKAIVKEESKVNEITINSVKVSKVKPIMERLDEALPNLAAAKSIKALMQIYTKDVLLSENANVDTMDAVKFINEFCMDKHGKTFKEYVGGK